MTICLKFILIFIVKQFLKNKVHCFCFDKHLGTYEISDKSLQDFDKIWWETEGSRKTVYKNFKKICYRKRVKIQGILFSDWILLNLVG